MLEPRRSRPPVAAGPVTLLFTDIEGSSTLWEQDGARMSRALAVHDTLARRAVESRHGTVVKMTGDGMHAVFGAALDALAAMLDMQHALADPAATHGMALRVRCGLHAGVVERRDNDYFGSAVNRAARIMSAAHGGQMLVSEAVADGVREMLPAAVALRDLGRVRLKDLATPEHVYQVVHPGLRQEFPALRSLEATPNNLPQQATRFIGREKELAALKPLLARTRLLTLTGSGGCGKTRLSLQLAAEVLEGFPDGAWLVDLAPLAEARLVAQTAASVLCLKEEPGKPIGATLAAHLADKRLLLLLDNCEHLLDGCAQLADMLLRQCPGVTLLASSREALGMGGEQAYRVPSLSLPNPKQALTSAAVAPFEAVQLFTDRALQVDPDFELTDRNAATLASVCQRLDGIPLAIELAAARVRSLSLDEINHKLDERFRLLTGGSRVALRRQQTLRSLIDWSYDLLKDPERLLLLRLSVFAGGWTLAAAETVCAGELVADAEVLDLLTSLCDKSLVATEHTDPCTRYRLLETVRQYARERLLEDGGGEPVRQRHRDFFLALAEESVPQLSGADQALWLQRLDEEHDNLRAALEWTRAQAAAEPGLRFAGALIWFWSMRGHLAEGREWCARVLALTGPEERTRARARALNAAGTLAWHQADYPAARARHETALAIWRELGEPAGVSRSLNNLGLVAWDQGDYPLATTLTRESLAMERELGDAGLTARSLNNLGLLAYETGDYAAAWALHQESLAIVRQLGDKSGIAASLNNLGEVAFARGDHPAGRALYQDSLELMRELGDKSGIANVLNNLGGAACAQADYAAALPLLEEALTLMRELGERSGIATSLNTLGSLAFDKGDAAAALALNRESLTIRHELGEQRAIAGTLEGIAEGLSARGEPLQAARLWGAAERLREALGSPLPPNERPRYERQVTAARAALPDARAFAASWQQGRALALERVIELGLQEAPPA
jgi:predicted ATPase/class 3 adenylate cyclase